MSATLRLTGRSRSYSRSFAALSPEALAGVVERWTPFAAALAIVTANVMDAAVRYMWVDELLTATLVTDPSLRHMVRALADQVDTTPPLFYVIAWGWGRVFGVSAMSLRALAGIFAAAAFVLVWRVLRPYFPLAVRCAAICAALLVPTVVLAQMAEARSYGLLLALCALTLVQVDRAATVDDRRGFSRVVELAAVAVVQAALCLTHVFGLAYSVAALSALVLFDIDRRRVRPLLYTAWLAGCLAFLVWLPALRVQMQVGAPHFPIARPTVLDLGRALLLGLTPRAAMLIFMAAGVAIAVARRSIPSASNAVDQRRGDPRHLVLVAVAWVLVAGAIWAWSRVATPIFLPRYLVPLSFAYAILGCAALDRALSWGLSLARCDRIGATQGPPAGSYIWVLAAMTAGALYAPISRADNVPGASPPAGDSLDFRYDLPIVTVSTHTYLPRVFYSAHPERYVFVLDWESALRQDSPVGPTEYKLMDAMHRYYPSHRVEQGASFLARNDRFLVLDEGELYWFKSRVLHNPDYRVTTLQAQDQCGTGRSDELCGLYLVERIAPDTGRAKAASAP